MVDTLRHHAPIPKFRGMTGVEHRILTQTEPTARSWAALQEVYELPSRTKGVRVLDVGGGGSDLTAALLEKEMDAYALDPRYTSILGVKRGVERYLANYEQQFGKAQGCQGLVAMERQALAEFMRSAGRRPDHYRHGFASRIPFPVNYFDLVVSSYCLTDHLDINLELLVTATEECIRVTKPGGSIQIFPFDTAEIARLDPADQDAYLLALHIRRTNQEALKRHLLTIPAVLGCQAKPLEKSVHKVFTIFKRR